MQECKISLSQYFFFYFYQQQQRHSHRKCAVLYTFMHGLWTWRETVRLQECNKVFLMHSIIQFLYETSLRVTHHWFLANQQMDICSLVCLLHYQMPVLWQVLFNQQCKIQSFSLPPRLSVVSLSFQWLLIKSCELRLYQSKGLSILVACYTHSCSMWFLFGHGKNKCVV